MKITDELIEALVDQVGEALGVDTGMIHEIQFAEAKAVVVKLLSEPLEPAPEPTGVLIQAASLCLAGRRIDAMKLLRYGFSGSLVGRTLAGGVVLCGSLQEARNAVDHFDKHGKWPQHLLVEADRCAKIGLC